MKSAILVQVCACLFIIYEKGALFSSLKYQRSFQVCQKAAILCGHHMFFVCVCYILGGTVAAVLKDLFV